MKHTPGPWELGNYDKSTVWAVNDFSTQRLQIANCKYLDQEFGEVIRDETRAEAEANARLIAAAPTMYEYIKKRSDEGCEQAQKIMQLLS